MSGLEIVVAAVIAIGLVGVVVPMLPGSLLVVAAILLWALDLGSAGGWTTFAVATALVVTGSVVKYLVPGRRLQRGGIPQRTLLAGAAVGVIGFFVVPVVGLPLGFVLGIYLSELQRTSSTEAWPATVAAIKAVGLGMLIELTFSVLAATAWAVGVVMT